MLPRSRCAAPKCKRKTVDEFELIERFFVREGESEGVITGIGDDGAVLAPRPGLELVTVIDTLVQGIHFPFDIDASDLGYRVVAVNLSDMAAMGAKPKWMTLALTLYSADEAWLAGFASGLFEAASPHDLALVGGDTTSGNAIVATAQITGEIAAGAAILRSGARPGDTIYVTGTVGDAAAGLELTRSGRPNDYLSRRYLRPTARLEFGRGLVGVATAAIDVSDGLYADLCKLLRASDVGGEIDIDKLPISAALGAAFPRQEQLRFALSGGDDYELCFTAPADAVVECGDLPVTAIGQVTDGDELRCRSGDRVVEYADSGYRHFK